MKPTGRNSTQSLMLALVCLIPAWQPVGQSRMKPDVIVAADGTGQYRTVQEAINGAPQTTSAASPWVILVKPGTYRELIYVQHEKRFVHLVGEDPAKTVITYDLNANLTGRDGLPIGTFRTPTAVIDADDFTVENITLENSAGPVGQALAVRVDGDRVAFRNCRSLGWQDTILLNRGRHYFERCYIEGHVDFIFGGATAWFEKCRIHCLRDGYITAASTPDYQPFGFVFSQCSISGESPEVKTYLGRPWRPFASVIFLNSEMSSTVRSASWHNWNQPDREKTARYAEFHSTGPGASPEARVSWARRLTEADAQSILLEKVLGGSDRWNPQERFRGPSSIARCGAGNSLHAGRQVPAGPDIRVRINRSGDPRGRHPAWQSVLR